MDSKAQVYLAAAVAAFAGTALYKYFNQPTAPEPVTRAPVHKEPEPISQNDITDLEAQITDMERRVDVWHNIAQAYPRDKDFAEECIKDIGEAIERHREAIASVRNILNFQAA